MSADLLLEMLVFLHTLRLPEPVQPNGFQFPLWQADMLFIRSCLLGEVSRVEALESLPALARYLKEHNMIRAAGRAVHIAAVLHHDLYSKESRLRAARSTLLSEAAEHFEDSGQVYYLNLLRSSAGVLSDGKAPGFSLPQIRLHHSRVVASRKRARFAYTGLAVASVVALSFLRFSNANVSRVAHLPSLLRSWLAKE
jgi:hypothetical protein